MRGLRTAAHAPLWPGDHDRLACFARVGGPPPPPAAVRCSASLRAHSRGDPPRTCCRRRTASAALHGSSPNLFCSSFAHPRSATAQPCLLRLMGGAPLHIGEAPSCGGSPREGAT